MVKSQYLIKWGNFMGNLHLVTGYAGEAHVASSDQGSLFEALIRSGQFVMDAGAKFSASIVSNNQIRVNDGELMMQGRHVKLTPGAYVDLAIDNGTQGYLRTDLIVARYTRNAATGIEECSLVVIKGTPAVSNAADPEYTTGSLNAEGALQHDFPLYRVSISGLILEGLTVLFAPQEAIFDFVQSALTTINSRLHLSVKTVSELRAINTSDTTLFKNGTLIMVQELGLLVFNRSAIGGNGADGNAIIAPISGGGGWVPTTPSDIPLSGREVSTAAELDIQLTNILTSMTSNTIKYTILNCVQPFAPFGGGIIHMTVYKTNINFAVIEARVYYSEPNIALQYTRSRYNGTWGEWTKLPYLDSNGKIPISQLPSNVMQASVE